MRSAWSVWIGTAALGLGLTACGQSASSSPPADAGLPFDGGSRDALLDPETCGSCHPQHFQDWVTSMHAKAADDPVFLAMNARGQRETGGKLGDFCVKCHAPLAVRDGLTKDGLNLAALPSKYHGVTCFFCHSIDSVDGGSNAAVGTATDLVMRGEIRDPGPNSVHRAAYSAFLDKDSPQSAAACGACHDIVVPPGLDDVGDAGDDGAAIERTFAEWKASGFGNSADPITCGASSCHMVESAARQPIAETTGYQGVNPPRNRLFHGHDFAAIDVPLEAGTDAAAAESAGVQALLSNALQGDLCVTGRGGIRVVVDLPNIGHDFPSGAAQDRRLWAEVVAYKGGSVVYQSGVVPFGNPAFDAGADPDLWVMRDCIFDPQGAEVNMFWQAAGPTDDNGLTPQASIDMTTPGSFNGGRVQSFPRSGMPLPSVPDRVTLKVWVQPVGSEVLADLVDSGDLDPSVAAAMPRFPVVIAPPPNPGAASDGTLEWTPQVAAGSGIMVPTDPTDESLWTCVGMLTTPPPNPPPPAHMKCSP
ncbi:MAG: multiheme c-type cytochrome, partial [Polyangiaceae bacterium]